MWRTIRYDRDGRVRRWQPTLPRLAAFAVAAGLSLLLARPCLRSVSPTAPPPPPAASPTPTVTPCDREPPFVVFFGRYTNYGYGYSVDVPDETCALDSAPPAPAHGCAIVLDDLSEGFSGYAEMWARLDDERRIWVDGSYNAAFVPTVDDEADDTIRWRRSEKNDLRVLARRRTTLGGLRAVRVTVEYTERATNRHVVEIWVGAGRRVPGMDTTEDDGGPRIDDVRYAAGLFTTPEHRAEDEKTFDRVLRSWRLRSVEG